jgi:hypothetical protein
MGAQPQPIAASTVRPPKPCAPGSPTEERRRALSTARCDRGRRPPSLKGRGPRRRRGRAPGLHPVAWASASTTPGSPASRLTREMPCCAASRTTLTLLSTRPSNLSYEDVRRGMARGTNHSAQEATRDTRREQKAQVGREKASAITRSTGLRRRERRFESCRGHCRGHYVDLGISLSVTTTNKLWHGSVG